MMDAMLHPMMMPVTFPLLAGLVCLLLPRRMEKGRALIAIAAAAGTVALVWPLFAARTGQLDAGPWISLKLDGLSALVAIATSVFGLLIAIYSYGFMKGKARQGEYYAYLLWTVGISLGAVMANELILLLVLWGLLGFTLYLMIGLAGPDASGAAKKSFIIIGGSDSVLLLGILLLWGLTGTTRIDAPALVLNRTLAYVAFFSFVAAAFAKAGAMPFHTWVPDCGEKAYASVTAFLPASLDKLLGIYLLVRTTTSLFVMNPMTSGLLMLFGAVTVLFAVMMALVQHDMKRLLAYHAVSQVGYMVLGIACGNAVGLAGGLFHMLNHAIYKSCLFLCAGSVEHRAGTSDLDRLGGLARPMPLTFVACMIAAFSISGIPPLNGFASKWMVYQGIITSGQGRGGLWTVWLAAAMLGSALTLASFVKLLHAVFLRKPAPELARKQIREVGFSMWLPVVVLAALCVVFGVLAYHLPLRHLIFPAIAEAVYLPGVWWAGPATVMLVTGFVAGLVLYGLSTARRVRVCKTYIGGEQLDATYLTGEKDGAERDVEITGVDFYETVQNIAPLRTIYRLAAQKAFDIYDVGIRVIFYFVENLRKAHAGLLPVYLTWVLAGLLVLMYLLLKG